MESRDQSFAALERTERLLEQSLRLLQRALQTQAEDRRCIEQVHAALKTSEQFLRAHELHFLSPSPFLPCLYPLFPERLLSTPEEDDQELSVT